MGNSLIESSWTIDISSKAYPLNLSALRAGRLQWILLPNLREADPCIHGGDGSDPHRHLTLAGFVRLTQALSVLALNQTIDSKYFMR